ncbi:hypothetical protein IMZ48_27615 [Candidatus Bathyarchaeota archaeon]|nr:hypothetical protein [Candidatus Bathyarchaeota archaeon]
MLLMHSDMLKALWFMIFPVVDYIHGPIASKSTFCQVSGFFLAVGIEASDIAVLLIAIHTALYIFRPKQPNGKNGLYPYRRWAYGAYVLFPFLMASLAFIHEPRPYANVGEFCYLPLKPSWPRAALSWVPRFFILVIILFIYISIYCYVSSLMKHFSRQDPTTAAQSPKLDAQQPGDSGLPAAPRPVYQSATPSRRGSHDVRDRRNSVSTLTSVDFDLGQAQYESLPYGSGHEDQSQPQWKWMDKLSADSPFSGHPHDPAASYENLCDVEFAPPPPSASAQGQSPQESAASTKQDPAALPFRRPSLQPSNTSQPSSGPSHTLRNDDRRPSCCSTTSTMPPDGDLPPMADTRHKVRQQLRLLFIYPLVYTIIWIVPFVSHVLTWPDEEDEVPYPIAVVALVSVCIQGAANSVLFSVWEKPWRHVRGDNVAGFRVGKGALVGRTREEMMVDGRIARVRLEVEMEERRRRETAAKRGSRHWWDLFDAESGDDEELLTR